MTKPIPLRSEQAARTPVPTFEEFFRAEHHALFSALCLITGSRQEAEDTMQDAFLSLLERWDRIASMDDPTGYLYRSAMNAFRKRNRRARLVLKRALGVGPRAEELAAAESRLTLAQMLAPLPPLQRAAIVLTNVLDYTSDEAAQLLGMRAGTVRTLASRGRAELRKKVREGDD